MNFNQYQSITPRSPSGHSFMNNNTHSIFNNRTLPLPVKTSEYMCEKEYAILALNSKRVYKPKNMPKVLNTMNYDNTKIKTARSRSTSLAEVTLGRGGSFNFLYKREETEHKHGEFKVPCNKEHKEHKHRDLNVTKENINNTCAVCDKVCQSPSALKIHMAIHSEGKPFKCFFCDKFISKFASNRNRHMKQVHQWDNGRK